MGDDYVPTMLQRFTMCFKSVKTNIEESHLKNKYLYDQRAKIGNFEIGDPVFYFNPARSKGTSSKLHLKWHPFYRIIEQTSPVNFKIRHQVTGKTKLVLSENLRPAHPDDSWKIEETNPTSVLNKMKTSKNVSRQQPVRKAKIVGENIDEPHPRPDLDDIPMEFDETPGDIIDEDSGIPDGIDVGHPSGIIADSVPYLDSHLNSYHDSDSESSSSDSSWESDDSLPLVEYVTTNRKRHISQDSDPDIKKPKFNIIRAISEMLHAVWSLPGGTRF
ncbi:hypothetical protein SNE40_017414 [Patella caerulea]|uniref:Uncharacterized protein n=1 Tax=Patella caerulea TaxID=87958 RepID=A0AAN8JDU8_PATCE